MKLPEPLYKTVPTAVYAAVEVPAAIPIIHVTRLLAPEVSNRGGVYVYEEQREHVS